MNISWFLWMDIIFERWFDGDFEISKVETKQHLSGFFFKATCGDRQQTRDTSVATPAIFPKSASLIFTILDLEGKDRFPELRVARGDAHPMNPPER